MLRPAATTRLFVKIQKTGRSLEEVVSEQILYDVKTGLDKAFVIDQATRNLLGEQDPGLAMIIKPVLRGEDLCLWYQEDEGRWLIFNPSRN